MVDDPYATAKSTLRDNVKTLVAMFGGVTAVLLAGTPFSGYAAVERWSANWWVATLSLLVAFGLLGWAVRMLLFILRPDFTSDQDLIGPTDDLELQRVRTLFEQQKANLLSKASARDPKIDTLEDLLAAEAKAWDDYVEQRDSARDANDRLVVADFKDAYDRLRENLQIIRYWLGFARLHVRVSRGVDKVMGIGTGAILAIALFVIASNAKKADAPASPQIYVVTPANPAPPEERATPLPVLAPVRFATNRADITNDAVSRIDAARAYLRTHPGTGVLIFANTDTRGGAILNARLAAKRAERVASLLRSEGGISASRVFVAPLAKTDLPHLTGQRTDSEANRSVEIILIPLPARQ